MISEESDAMSAYLFQCGDEPLFAVSLDQTGGNLPRKGCSGWRLKAEFALGVHAPVPAAISPEPILRGVYADGYYIWRDGYMHGTTQ